MKQLLIIVTALWLLLGGVVVYQEYNHQQAEDKAQEKLEQRDSKIETLKERNAELIEERDQAAKDLSTVQQANWDLKENMQKECAE